MLGETFSGTLQAARTGAEWAWTSIYRDLAPGVLGYLRARRAHEPEDPPARVFLQVVRDVPRFAGGEREFRAWAFAIAPMLVLDRVIHGAPTDSGAGPSAVSTPVHPLAATRRWLSYVSPRSCGGVRPLRGRWGFRVARSVRW